MKPVVILIVRFATKTMKLRKCPTRISDDGTDKNCILVLAQIPMEHVVAQSQNVVMKRVDTCDCF